MIQIFAAAGKLQVDDISRTVQFVSVIIADHA
jgi:hypothetical protein